MDNVSRRSAMRIATVGVATAGAAVLGRAGASSEPQAPQLWTLEGELKVHPKYLYRFYLVCNNGQQCALYGADHGRDPDHLASLTLPVRVRVRGAIGTAHHSGGTKENPSPFPETWIVYMDVHEVESLK